MLSPNKAPFRYSLGTRGETAAWSYLQKHGVRILDKNYRCKIGEIDIVAEKDGRIVFIEVKTRTSGRFGLPEESVHPRKQQKLIRLAEWYLKEKKQIDAKAGFAVLAVDWKPGESPQIRFIENAFTVDNQGL